MRWKMNWQLEIYRGCIWYVGFRVIQASVSRIYAGFECRAK